ncbi:hypothetical protein ACK1GZ_004693, partial [Salmonella enterica]
RTVKHNRISGTYKQSVFISEYRAGLLFVFSGRAEYFRRAGVRLLRNIYPSGLTGFLCFG